MVRRRLAGMDSNPHPQALGRLGIVCAKALLDVGAGANRIWYPVECGHDAVAGVFHLAPAMSGYPRLTEDRLDRGEIDGNDVGGDFAMPFAMDVPCGRRIGRINETEARAPLGIVPIGQARIGPGFRGPYDALQRCPRPSYRAGRGDP
jgi:hypothetical protein